MTKQELAAELNKIAAKHGGHATAEQIVEEVTPKRHPLHDHFEWDNAVCGHQWRLKQARALLRVTVVMRRNSAAVHIPIFTSLPRDRGVNGYRSTAEVMANPAMSLERDLDVLKRVEAILARAASPRLSPLLSQVAHLIATLEQGDMPEAA